MIAAANKPETPAETNMLFKSPDLVRTGQASRVELTAKDRTITVNATGVLLVPEPATALTLILTFAGFGLVRQR